MYYKNVYFFGTYFCMYKKYVQNQQGLLLLVLYSIRVHNSYTVQEYSIRVVYSYTVLLYKSTV